MGILVDSGQHRVVCAGRAIAQPARKCGSLPDTIQGRPKGSLFPSQTVPMGSGGYPRAVQDQPLVVDSGPTALRCWKVVINIQKCMAWKFFYPQCLIHEAAC